MMQGQTTTTSGCRGCWNADSTTEEQVMSGAANGRNAVSVTVRPQDTVTASQPQAHLVMPNPSTGRQRRQEMEERPGRRQEHWRMRRRRGVLEGHCSCQNIASSFGGSLVHWRRQHISGHQLREISRCQTVDSFLRLKSLDSSRKRVMSVIFWLLVRAMGLTVVRVHGLHVGWTRPSFIRPLRSFCAKDHSWQPRIHSSLAKRSSSHASPPTRVWSSVLAPHSDSTEESGESTALHAAGTATISSPPASDLLSTNGELQPFGGGHPEEDLLNSAAIHSTDTNGVENRNGSSLLDNETDALANVTAHESFFGHDAGNGTVELDAPVPTANGGYTHTRASRAKISKANRGKTPWNKGRARSEEERGRISAGVRKRNHERLLAKLERLGLTQEEYEERRKEERRIRDKERRDRIKAAGNETESVYQVPLKTREKISATLRERWARGEVAGYVNRTAKATNVTKKGKVRVGFKHTEETKEKIRHAVRKRWAEDPEYRQKVRDAMSALNSNSDVRSRIAATLKRRWKDPEFRAYMTKSFRERDSSGAGSGTQRSETFREKISLAMKKKWADDEYRQRAVSGMARARAIAPPRKRKERVSSASTATPRKRPILKPPKLKGTKTTVVSEGTKKRKVRVFKKVKKKTKKKSLDESKLTAVALKPMEPQSIDWIQRLMMEETEEDIVEEEQEDKDEGNKKATKKTGASSRKKEESEEPQLEDFILGTRKDLKSSSRQFQEFIEDVTELLNDDDDLDDFDPYGLESDKEETTKGDEGARP